MFGLQQKWEVFQRLATSEIPYADNEVVRMQLARRAANISIQLVDANFMDRSKVISDEWERLIKVVGQYLDGEKKAIEGKL